MLPHPSGSFLYDLITVRRGNPAPVLRDLLFCPTFALLWPPGGRQSKYAVNAFEVFDIETRSWTKFPNIPCKRAFSSFVTLDDRLYSLGGLRQGRLYQQPKFLRTMDVFDMEQGKLGTSPRLRISLLAESPTLPPSHPSTQAHLPSWVSLSESEHPSPFRATLGIKFFHLYRVPFDWLVVFIKAFSTYCPFLQHPARAR